MMLVMMMPTIGGSDDSSIAKDQLSKGSDIQGSYNHVLDGWWWIGIHVRWV
jgi:hypothetical protein